MIPLYHARCGLVAFYASEDAVARGGIRASDVVLVDGTEPVVGYRTVCGSCGSLLLGETVIAAPARGRMD